MSLFNSLIWAVLVSGAICAQGELAWTVQRLGAEGTNPPPRLLDVAVGNARYVALTTQGEVYSAAASFPMVWTRNVGITNAIVGDIVFAEGSFHALGRERNSDTRLILSSIDGTNWS